MPVLSRTILCTIFITTLICLLQDVTRRSKATISWLANAQTSWIMIQQIIKHTRWIRYHITSLRPKSRWITWERIIESALSLQISHTRELPTNLIGPFLIKVCIITVVTTKVTPSHNASCVLSKCMKLYPTTKAYPRASWPTCLINPTAMRKNIFKSRQRIPSRRRSFRSRTTSQWILCQQ